MQAVGSFRSEVVISNVPASLADIFPNDLDSVRFLSVDL